jgi:segregation and condensation protein B
MGCEMGRRAKTAQALLDVDSFDALPPELQWREWMGRVEAIIFAAPRPVTRAALERVVGQTCNVDELIDDIRAELKARPYELVAVAGGWQFRTKKAFADAIRAAAGVAAQAAFSKTEQEALTAIAHFQPLTRRKLSEIFGREISRDVIAALRGSGFVASGPRSPRAGAPMTYVTTGKFLEHHGFESLADLPDMEALRDAGLLSKDSLLSGVITEVLIPAEVDAFDSSADAGLTPHWSNPSAPASELSLP